MVPDPGEFEQRFRLDPLLDPGKDKGLLVLKMPARGEERFPEQAPGWRQIGRLRDLGEPAVDFLVFPVQAVAPAPVFRALVQRQQHQVLLRRRMIHQQALHAPGQPLHLGQPFEPGERPFNLSKHRNELAVVLN